MIEYYRGFDIKQSRTGEFFAVRVTRSSITTRNHETIDALKADIDTYWGWELAKNSKE